MRVKIIDDALDKFDWEEGCGLFVDRFGNRDHSYSKDYVESLKGFIFIRNIISEDRWRYDISDLGDNLGSFSIELVDFSDEETCTELLKNLKCFKEKTQEYILKHTSKLGKGLY